MEKVRYASKIVHLKIATKYDLVYKMLDLLRKDLEKGGQGFRVNDINSLCSKCERRDYHSAKRFGMEDKIKEDSLEYFSLLFLTYEMTRRTFPSIRKELNHVRSSTTTVSSKLFPISQRLQCSTACLTKAVCITGAFTVDRCVCRSRLRYVHASGESGRLISRLGVLARFDILLVVVVVVLMLRCRMI